MFPGDRARADDVRNTSKSLQSHPNTLHFAEFKHGRCNRPLAEPAHRIQPKASPDCRLLGSRSFSRSQSYVPSSLPPVPFPLHEISPRAIHDHRRSGSGNPGCRESISETGKNEQRERTVSWYATVGRRVRFTFLPPWLSVLKKHTIFYRK